MTKHIWIFTFVAITWAVALAQPTPPTPPPAPASDAAQPPPTPAPAQPDDPYGSQPPPQPQPQAPPQPRPRPRDPAIAPPEVITTPTGWLLPAAVLYSRTGLDTGGGFKSDQRVGLGDVAEFGVATLDQVRARDSAVAPSHHIQPYIAATFRMGVAEDRLFLGQPGIVLGFRKSFERNDAGMKTRIAELTLVASKHVGPRAAVHIGGAFWDAELQGGSIDTRLHDRDVHPFHDQIRAFGGIQVRPLDRSEILIDLGWAPEFCYTCSAPDQIQLRPELAWGVRYQVADYMSLESGVRLPDIANANLLEAQIFGQVVFTSWAIRHWVDDLK